MKRSSILSILLLVIVALIMVPVLPAYADGISPLLAAISFKIFLFGQVWILLSETVYIKILLKKVRYLTVFYWTFLINAVTTLIGGLIIPSIIFILIAFSLPIEDGQHQSPLALKFFQLLDSKGGSTLLAGFLFIITYILSALIEGALLYKLQKNKVGFEKKFLLKHSFGWNLVSYVGLLAIYLYGSYAMNACGISPYCFIS